ncbi:MAG TPA: 4Fe-4S dicluster domain-containing protein, partial [Deltaproteobacteria bacterium]|nr:4Fe-4S dicluster domain-containing protein [Deltaproteobacteria bacterium]
MSSMSDFRFFREDLCDRCGTCFERCPVLELSRDEAQREIEALISGHTGASLVLQRCVTCNACDFICPRHANPYGLILQRHHEAGRAEGLPYMARFIFPNEPENMWTTTRVL